MYTDPATGAGVLAIKKVAYTHDAMIDMLIANPQVTQNQLAATFGYTPGWVSTVINSDAFQARLAERKGELVDPSITRSVEERFKAVAQLSLDKVLEKLELPAGAIDDDFLINSAKLATSALGYGVKAPGSGGPSVIINMPGVAVSAADWKAKHARPVLDSLAEVIPIKASLTVDHEVATIAVPRAP